jgi:hypothetical protein
VEIPPSPPRAVGQICTRRHVSTSTIWVLLWRVETARSLSPSGDGPRRGRRRLRATSSVTERRDQLRVETDNEHRGEPPNHALISPSPTKFAGRCEPSGSMTQTGCPSWNWPSPMLVIGAQVDAYRRRTLLCEHTDAKSAPCGQLNTKSDAKAGPPAGPVWCRKEDAR